jgi:hypothetical protein
MSMRPPQCGQGCEKGRLVAIGIIGRLGLAACAGEQFAGARDVVGAGSLGEQAVVADAVESLPIMPPNAVSQCNGFNFATIFTGRPKLLVLWRFM